VCVDLAQRADVAGLQRGEEADDKFHGSASFVVYAASPRAAMACS
jgi:hypothetical protein